MEMMGDVRFLAQNWVVKAATRAQLARLDEAIKDMFRMPLLLPDQGFISSDPGSICGQSHRIHRFKHQFWKHRHWQHFYLGHKRPGNWRNTPPEVGVPLIRTISGISTEESAVEPDYALTIREVYFAVLRHVEGSQDQFRALVSQILGLRVEMLIFPDKTCLSTAHRAPKG